MGSDRYLERRNDPMIAIREAVAAENERCAELCETLGEKWDNGDYYDTAYVGAFDCANAIRASKPEGPT